MKKNKSKKPVILAIIMALVSATAYAGPCSSWWCTMFPNSVLCDCEQA